MKQDANPLLAPWEGEWELPPFDAVRPEHFRAAVEAGCAERRAEVEAIAAQAAPPDFDNTVAAFDASGRLLARVLALFHNLGASASTPALQAVERELAAPLAAHEHWVHTHERLFARIDAVHAARESLALDGEQRRLVERIHLDFVRAGARLAGSARERYGELMQRLAEATTRFAQNVLADENDWQLVLRGEDELRGLPAFVRAAARQAAQERGVAGADAHAITLSRSLIEPFLAFSERRDLREIAWRAWTTRGEHAGEHDNRPLVTEILALRREQARAHGHATYADYALADTMAGTPAAARALLEQAWERALLRAERERADLEALARTAGEPTPIEPWDWRFLAERVRRERFALDEAEVKPYFALDRMVQAAFDCAGRLFGIAFVARPELQAYHPDVQVYEVQGDDGAPLGLFLHDNHARPGKRSGAWMSVLRWQSGAGTVSPVRPVVLNNNNFAKAAPGSPTLLSFDDARTLFHEFGHGLHGLLSAVRWRRLSGTQVLRDFVELPSQLFEHWLAEPEVLKRHARHAVSGEPMPDALIARLRAAETFNQGFDTVSYVASALVDLAVHAHPQPDSIDVAALERDELARLGAPALIGMRHRLPHFLHLFASAGYAAGYYVYLWAEVLDADAFDAFREAGDTFDPALAARLRRCIYGAGNSLEPGAAYRAFRGRDARVEPMLRGRGLLES
ncbi:MAG TPA: M3 family metallopeptidase [Ideonella sp.]|nr:M3 family metallopeptidase [Ideonella sp.]